MRLDERALRTYLHRARIHRRHATIKLWAIHALEDGHKLLCSSGDGYIAKKGVPLTSIGRLHILIDSESLSRLLSQQNALAERLLRYSDAQLFQFIRSPLSTPHKEMQKVIEFKKIFDENNDLAAIRFDGGSDEYSETGFGYRMEDIKKIATNRYGKHTLTEMEIESIVLVFIYAILSRHRDSHILVSENDTLLRNERWFENHFPGGKMNIMSVEETLTFMDLFAKFRNVYYVSSRFECNRGSWYLYSFKTKVANYQTPWSCSVFGLPIGDSKRISQEFSNRFQVRDSERVLQGFSNRFQDLLRAVDEIGFEFYKGVNNDTMDGMVYHFNYYISIVTGLFDNLAILSTLYYSLPIRGVNIAKKKNMNRISLRRYVGKDFLKSLSNPNKNLHNFIMDNEDFIEMFYHFREEVIHRAGLRRMGFHCVDKDMTWQMNAIMLPKEISDIIETYDQRSEFEPITRWGVYGNGQSFLEPFRFVRATTGKLVEFCNKYFELLDFDKRLEQYPEVRHSMEESNKTKAHQDYANYLALFVKDHLGF